jgi:hypothetical protein
VPDYAKLAATAKRLIEQNGRPVTLYKANREPADPAQPWRGVDLGSAPTGADGGGRISNVKAAFVPVRGTSLGQDATEGPEGLQRDIEQSVLIAATSLPAGSDLSAYDTLLDGGRIWRIYSIGKLAPGTTTLIWDLGVGR